MKDWIFVLIFLVCIGFVSQVAYQQGYDQAKSECKPIKTKIPLKDMTHKQAVRAIQWQFRDRGVILK